MRIKLGIDIGGTEIKGGAVYETGGHLAFKIAEKTNAKEGLGAFLSSLDRVVLSLIRAYPEIKTAGIASAGNINRDNGTVIYATDNLPGYTGFNLAGYFKEKFALDVVCDNDAYAALYGEAKSGGIMDAAMITLGTGVGGAIMKNGKIIRGENFDEARFGHFTLYSGGRLCTCGKTGCAEMYVSGSAFTKSMIESGINISHGSEGMLLAKNGDTAARQILSGFLKELAVLINAVVSRYSPGVIIIGGGMINSKDCFWNELCALCGSEIKLLAAKLGNDAGVIGAALMT